MRNDPRVLQDAAEKSLNGFFEVINAAVKSNVSYSASILREEVVLPLSSTKHDERLLGFIIERALFDS